MQDLRAVFESHFHVRPDDIDMNQHVHSSRYLDYVLAARYDQMARCYGMPMEEFLRHGYSWVMRTAWIDYLRPLGLGDSFIVRTTISELGRRDVTVRFEIDKGGNGKRVCEGKILYIMIDAATGRATVIPDWIREKYAI